MKPLTTIETAFGLYSGKLEKVANYIGALTPTITQNRSVMPVFVESLVIMMVARLEHFLTSLLASAVHHREPAVREHFRKHGNDQEQAVAATADRRTLILMVRRRINFKSNGKGIERMFEVLFGFSPWPNNDVFHLILDLVLLRNIFVHEGDSVLEEHARQAHRQHLFTVRAYKDLKVYGVDHVQALIHVRDATVALKQLLDHVRAELLSRDEWVYKPPKPC